MQSSSEKAVLQAKIQAMCAIASQATRKFRKHISQTALSTPQGRALLPTALWLSTFTIYYSNSNSPTIYLTLPSPSRVLLYLLHLDLCTRCVCPLTSSIPHTHFHVHTHCTPWVGPLSWEGCLYTNFVTLPPTKFETSPFQRNTKIIKDKIENVWERYTE